MGRDEEKSRCPRRQHFIHSAHKQTPQLLKQTLCSKPAHTVIAASPRVRIVGVVEQFARPPCVAGVDHGLRPLARPLPRVQACAA
jgi:hypothetical protein